jgi:predicted  nucleic acid-binding Zn-ribbon protein
MMLSQLNEQAADAEKQLAGGSYREKVDAAGELAVLKRRRDTIENRFKELSRNHAESDNMISIIREELFNLSLSFRQLLSGR